MEIAVPDAAPEEFAGLLAGQVAFEVSGSPLPGARARCRLFAMGAPEHPDGRDEAPLQRADRNFAELLQELRVTQTGVQILFAFLLTLSFTDRFERITEFQRIVYVVTLVASAITAALLIAPVAAHRLQFQLGRKAELVRFAHRCVLGGLATLLITMVGALLLVLDVTAGTTFAVCLTVAVAVCFVALWFVAPRLSRGEQNPGERGHEIGR